MQIYANVRYVSKSLLVLIFPRFSPFCEFTEGDLGMLLKRMQKQCISAGYFTIPS